MTTKGYRPERRGDLLRIVFLVLLVLFVLLLLYLFVPFGTGRAGPRRHLSRLFSQWMIKSVVACDGLMPVASSASDKFNMLDPGWISRAVPSVKCRTIASDSCS